jgi:transposase
LLEAGRDEEFIEKDTGVSDRTIRRWKMELERTGRIGKPPESRTGRHRVLNAEVETVSTTVVARGLSARAGELMRTVAGAVRAC